MIRRTKYISLHHDKCKKDSDKLMDVIKSTLKDTDTRDVKPKKNFQIRDFITKIEEVTEVIRCLLYNPALKIKV